MGTCTFLLTISNLSHCLIFAKVCLTVRHGYSIVFCNSVCRSHVVRHTAPGRGLAGSLPSLDRYAISLLTSNLAFLFSCRWLLFDGYHFPFETWFCLFRLHLNYFCPSLFPRHRSSSGSIDFMTGLRVLFLSDADPLSFTDITFVFSMIKFLFNVALMGKRRWLSSQPCDLPCKMLNKWETDISNMITSWNIRLQQSSIVPKVQPIVCIRPRDNVRMKDAMTGNGMAYQATKMLSTGIRKGERRLSIQPSVLVPLELRHSLHVLFGFLLSMVSIPRIHKIQGWSEPTGNGCLRRMSFI